MLTEVGKKHQQIIIIIIWFERNTAAAEQGRAYYVHTDDSYTPDKTKCTAAETETETDDMKKDVLTYT